ncbi:hypothetical protein AOCH_000062 [Aspergillus ochraceoroseus]|uniref:Steroid monooxygenase n=1 Tax=Aspergillus ochraceoroseus TaxID=138278 RepID=A0A0F8TYT5_9EURO|nr:hypothetical protein AOCH_000062 [Aspergillus ochraceoroseus]
MKSNLREFAPVREKEGSAVELDVLIIGAGFSGIYCLHEVRKLGLRSAIFEAGSDVGGTWRWNCYPGAGVDSEAPEYQFSIPETWAHWNWSTNYPTYKEIRAYLDHVSHVLDIRKDCFFGAVVTKAEFDMQSGRWSVETQDGPRATAKYLIVGSGFATKRYVPAWPGIDSFKGVIHHSAFWPEDAVDVRGKRCAVIGTGASGVQITQALGPLAGSLKVFQRTPNLAIPMYRRELSVEEQERIKPVYPELFRLREKCFGGFFYTWAEKELSEDSEEEREAFLESLWTAGGFRYWLGTYKDALFSPQANRIIYDFWARKVRARIHNPSVRDLLAPEEPPHAFGIKRPCLEVNYYEQFNRSNVQLIDIRENPIASVTETGLKLADGTQHELDVICVATGFDSSTGGIMDMGLRSVHGVEVQGRWVVDAIKLMERRGIKYIDPTPEASRAWKHRIDELSNRTLLPTVCSTYMGGTIPGKPFEQLNYTGGLPAYTDEIRQALPGFRGFEVSMHEER